MRKDVERRREEEGRKRGECKPGMPWAAETLTHATTSTNNH